MRQAAVCARGDQADAEPAAPRRRPPLPWHGRARRPGRRASKSPVKLRREAEGVQRQLLVAWLRRWHRRRRRQHRRWEQQGVEEGTADGAGEGAGGKQMEEAGQELLVLLTGQVHRDGPLSLNAQAHPPGDLQRGRRVRARREGVEVVVEQRVLADEGHECAVVENTANARVEQQGAPHEVLPHRESDVALPVVLEDEDSSRDGTERRGDFPRAR
mmetsp:Transcript_50733/g.164396  ORF Transcript_50733/g.164396 Transcript_50733/m.164396 type:complete len:215 (+) Transcript_50733:544-1188(+)